jgi:hypothetical protein
MTKPAGTRFVGVPLEIWERYVLGIKDATSSRCELPLIPITRPRWPQGRSK